MSRENKQRADIFFSGCKGKIITGRSGFGVRIDLVLPGLLYALSLLHFNFGVVVPKRRDRTKKNEARGKKALCYF